MPDGHTRRRSRGSDSESNASSAPSRQSRRRSQSVEGPPTPTSPLEARGKKRRAHFQDDPVDTDHVTVTSAHRRQPSATSPITNFCLCQREPKIPRPRNAFILYRQAQAKLGREDRNLSNPQFSKVVGEEWSKLPDYEKAEWNRRAEVEKAAHQEKYPGYRYQPKRSRKSSNLESPLSAGFSSSCEKCGGRTMLSPTTPGNTHQTPRPSLPPISSSPTSVYNHACPPHNPQTMPPSRRQSGRPQHLNLAPREEDDRYSQQSPDTKRRRTMAPPSHDSMQHRQSVATPHPAQFTPYPQDFTPRNFAPYTNQPPHPHANRPWPGPTPMTGSMPPPPRPPYSHPPTHHPTETDQSLNLPPLQMAPQCPPATPQAYIMDMPWLNKLRTCARVCPPLKPRPNNLPRGVLIAIEGDYSGAVAQVAQYLESKMKREPENEVSLTQGPKDPPTAPAGPESAASGAVGLKVGFSDYTTLVSEWHARSKQTVSKLQSYGENKKKRKAAEMAEELVSPRDTSCPPPLAPKSASATSNADGDTSMTGTAIELPVTDRKPILLVSNYLYHATNTWACAIPIQDAYTPSDHWQWMATLWRGVVGADLTVFVRDVEKGESEVGKAVEVLEGYRTLVVRREKKVGAEWDDGVLRRVAFEVDEWILGMERERR